PLRRRSPGVQEADLRDALRPRKRRLCPLRKFLYRIALSREPPARSAGRNLAAAQLVHAILPCRDGACPVSAANQKIGGASGDAASRVSTANYVLSLASWEICIRACPYPRAPRETSRPPCADGIFVRRRLLHSA